MHLHSLFLHPFLHLQMSNAFHPGAFGMEIHLLQQSRMIQLYYLSVKEAAATCPAGGN